MMKIAVNGVGRVGLALLDLLKKNHEDVRIVYLAKSDRYFISKEGIKIEDLDLHNINYIPKNEVKENDFNNFLKDIDVDIWFELTPSIKERGEIDNIKVLNLLRNRISVVLANKNALLYDYLSLKNAADKSKVKLGLSGVLGAAFPSYAIIHYAIMGSKVLSLEGILNGTSSFILSKMEEGYSFNESLSQAQQLGIAEGDWKNDVDGIDSAVKMSLIASVVMQENITFDINDVKGIREIENEEFKSSIEKGEKYKLIAEFKNGKVSVRPKKISRDDLFYKVEGANKALKISTDSLSDMILIGGKSGLKEVAASLYRDMLWIKEWVDK